MFLDDVAGTDVFSGLGSCECHECWRSLDAFCYWKCMWRFVNRLYHQKVHLCSQLAFHPLPNTALTSPSHRTGRYKAISVLGALSASLAYTLMILRWHGHTSFLESLYIIPGGFGNGIALSASFIALTAGVDAGQIAIASSGLYLSSSLGMVSGLSVAAAILQSTLRKELRIRLEGWGKREMVSFDSYYFRESKDDG